MHSNKTATPLLLLAAAIIAGSLGACANKPHVAAAKASPDGHDAGEAPATEPEPEAEQHPVVDLGGAPLVEALTLAAGFGPEHREFTVPTGGEQEAPLLGPDCVGRISRRPSVKLDYTAGDKPLNIYVTTEADTTLAVRLPDGNWLCNDDYIDHDPAVLMNSPLSGTYLIWVGSYDGIPGQAALRISEERPVIEVPSKGDLTRTPDVVFVPTPQAAVDELLAMAEIKKGDILYDLGCGDGRFVVTAAKKYGIRAFGFDIDPQRIEESKANVRKAKVEHLVTIQHADIFTLDLSKATVVTLYLLPRLNIALMPQLSKMKPGSRIVSFDFDMKGAKPHTVVTKSFGDSGMRTLYKWVVPWEEE